jgi:hypothetical protein
MRNFTMLNATSKRAKFALIVSVLFVLSAMAPVSLARSDQGPLLLVVDYAADGTVVSVTVHNLSKQAQTANVYVDAIVNSNLVRGYTPVTIFARGSATTLVGFTGTVDSVEVVGIIDDSTPM